MSGFIPPSFADACSYLVRVLVQTAYSMATNSVRPSNQPYPTGDEMSEFATVKIMAGPAADFGAWSTTWLDDPATNSTKVIENIENVYRFTTSIQFFRHATPTKDAAGLSKFGLSAVDKAARLDAILSSETMMQLMERMGLGLEDASEPRDVSALVDSATWEDRGSVDMTFVIVNREQFLLESFGALTAEIRAAEPGRSQSDILTIDLPQVYEWSPTGSLATARGYHTLTRLPDDTMLAIGGEGGNWVEYDTAELFTRSAGTWATLASRLVQATTQHAASLLLNGDVLVTGGAGGADNGGVSFDNIQRFVYATKQFVDAGHLNIARQLHTQTTLDNGDVLIAGGFSNGSENTMELWISATGEIVLLDNLMTVARFNHTATKLKNGMVVLAGGADGGSQTATVDVYDPATRSCTAVVLPMTAQRSQHVAVLLDNGDVLLAGGVTLGNGVARTSAELFHPGDDPTQGTFEAVADMAQGRIMAVVAPLPGAGSIVAGGIDSAQAPLGTAAMFIAATKRWQEVDPATTGLFGAASAAASFADGSVLLAGGYGAVALASAEIFQPSTTP